MKAKVINNVAQDNIHMTITVEFYQDDGTTLIFTDDIHIANAESDGPTAKTYIENAIKARGDLYTANVDSQTKVEADNKVDVLYSIV